MSPGSNYILTEAIKSGDEKAFQLFFKSEFNNVLFFANQFVKDYSLAKDIAQETFISLWNARENLNPEANICAYTFRLARNKALNLLREKHISSSDSFEKREVQVFIGALSGRDVEERINALDFEKLIRKTYDSLNENIRHSFVLSREHGLTYDEIAKKRGLSKKAIEYHMNVALKVMRKKLKEFLPILISTFLKLI